jgi:hypothetical protein
MLKERPCDGPLDDGFVSVIVADPGLAISAAASWIVATVVDGTVVGRLLPFHCAAALFINLAGRGDRAGGGRSGGCAVDVEGDVPAMLSLPLSCSGAREPEGETACGGRAGRPVQ